MSGGRLDQIRAAERLDDQYVLVDSLMYQVRCLTLQRDQARKEARRFRTRFAIAAATPAAPSRCGYCGAPCRDGVCRAHTDLLEAELVLDG